MPRIGWERLKPSTRSRYSRAGITKRSYESGADLTAARGHARTPDKANLDLNKLTPEQRERYSEYFRNKRGTTELIRELKQQLWGDEHKFRSGTSNNQARKGTLKDMRFALTASIEDLEQLAGSGDERWAFLWYH